MDPIDGRGCVDMFLARNRQIIGQASVMADQKASIILGLEVLVLTIILKEYLGLQSSPDGVPEISTIFWLLPLGFFTLISIIFALIVLMPSIGGISFSQRRPAEKTPPNLLFFASIAQLDRNEFIEQMEEVLRSDEKIYRAILTDIHQESTVLFHKKFLFLKFAYRSFLGGLLISFIWVIAEQADRFF
ncbi:MAG: Pycsar system effector family protein [Verrucomicrobiota bacterium]